MSCRAGNSAVSMSHLLVKALIVCDKIVKEYWAKEATEHFHGNGTVKGIHSNLKKVLTATLIIVVVWGEFGYCTEEDQRNHV